MNINSILNIENKNNNHNNYRPISFSETHLDDLKKESLIQKNSIRDEYILIDTKKFKNTESQTDPETKTHLWETIINKLILFFTHLFLVAIFELIFFFNFVTKYEDKALVDVFNQMTNQATSICSSLNQYDKKVVDNFLGLFLNTTKINEDSNNAYNLRTIYNHTLLSKGVYYFLYVTGLNFLIILLNFVWFRRKINYKTIIIDNLVMISLLGLFEYLFFSTIIFNYQTISPNELNKQISDSVLKNC